MMILSGDPPRSRLLSVLLLVIVVALAVTPFVFPGAKAMNVAHHMGPCRVPPLAMWRFRQPI